MLLSHQNTTGLTTASPVHFSRTAKSFRRQDGAEYRLGRDYAMDQIEELLPMHGIGFGRGVLERMTDYAMDTIQQPLTTPNIATPIQFLQNWMPGVVEIVTAKQAIDELVGRATVGSWEDEQVVQQVIEMTGAAVPYTDLGNSPLASWNPNFVIRSVVRFELGQRVNNLEEAQSARMRIDSAGQKRKSIAIQLEIQRNAVGFYGYNSGNAMTYGLLNDPNLSAYTNAPTGNWASSTFAQIQGDLLTAFQALRTQSQGRITPNKDPITLAVPTSKIDYLAKSTDFGYSVWQWLTDFYPNVTVVDAPQLTGANGGADVFYVYADTVRDSGTDDLKTFMQIVPSTFQLLGIQKLTKGFEELYSNATAGVLCKRPYAVKRYTGI